VVSGYSYHFKNSTEQINQTMIDCLRLPSLRNYYTKSNEDTFITFHMCKSNTTREEATENALPGGTHGCDQRLMLNGVR